MCGRYFPNLDFDCMTDLEQNLCDALNLLEQTPESIRSVTRYKWFLNLISILNRNWYLGLDGLLRAQ